MDINSLKLEILEYIKKYNLPYFDIVIMKDHNRIFQYGFMDNCEVDGNEIMAMFSMSKPITSAVILNLINEGKIALSDDVSKYIPEYKNLKVLSTNGEYLPANNILTIENCLSMRGGFDYNLWKESIVEVTHKNSDATLQDYAYAIVGKGLLFEPGTNYQYSLSFDLLGAIIEKVTGDSFSSYVKKTIFDKLNMNYTTFCNKKNECDSLIIERKLIDNEWKIVNRIYKDFLFSNMYESSGAGLISTINDYVKFADALACGGISEKGVRIISENSIEEMRKARTQNVIPDATYNGSSCDDYGYGLGVRVRTNTNEYGIPKGEFGWDGALGCYSLMDTENKISIVIGLSIQMWPDSLPGFHVSIANIVYKHLLK